MKKILVGIFVVLFSLPAMAVNVSGTVFEKCDTEDKAALPGVAVMEVGTTRGTITDIQGKFTLRNVTSNDSKIEFSFLGFTTKTLLASELGGDVEVCLEESSEVIDNVIVETKGEEDCGLNFLKSKSENYINELSDFARDRHKFILDGTWQVVGEGEEATRICVPRTCMTGYKKSVDRRSCVSRNGDPCERSELRALSGEHARSGTYSFEYTGDWWKEDVTEKCTNVTCDTNYEPNTDGTRCVPDCDVISERDRSRGVKAKTLIDGQCYPSECHGPRYKLEGTEKSAQCVDLVGTDCDYTGTKAAGFDDRVESTKYVADGPDYGIKCVVAECKDPEFVPNDDGTDCEWGESTCSEQTLRAIAFAKRGHWDGTKCIVKACKGSLKVDKENNKCGCGSLPKGVRDQRVPTDTTLQNPHCEPTHCIGERWILDGSDQSATCKEQECTIEHGQGKWVKDGDEYLCQVDKCDCGYAKSDDSKSCTPKTDAQKQCTADTDPKLPKGAAAATMTCEENRNREYREYCKISSCKEGYRLVESKNECVSNCKCGQKWDEAKQQCRAKTAEEKNCTDEVENAKSATLACDGETEYCKVSKCNDGYEISEDKKSCQAIGGDCKPKDKNARTGTRVYNQNTGKEWCKITACLGGYKVSDDGKECEPTGKVKEAQEKYDLARKHEQSLENKMLGGLSMGTIGIGGKMLAQGLAEQAADKDAEADMKAYLATFKCDYGAGRNIQGGKTNIELPGAAEMIPLYAEYVTLANDLKARKKQLGLKAGIESQKILDAATTGLYDDVGVGITSGAYASLARAMLNPDGEDADMWADQQKKSKKLVTAGAVTAGLGIVGSIVGYVASNRQYEKASQALEERLAALRTETPTCPEFAPGDFPDCDCLEDNTEFNTDTGECDDVTRERESGDSEQNSTACPEGASGEHPNCNCGERRYDPESRQCVQENGTEEETVERPVRDPEEVMLPADTLFANNSAELRPEAQSVLDDFIADLALNQESCSDFEVHGYADPTGRAERNNTLSQERADAVKDYFMSKPEFMTLLAGSDATATGHGSSDCTCALLPNPLTQDQRASADYSYCVGRAATDVVPAGQPFAPCRRVTLKMNCTPKSDAQ